MTIKEYLDTLEDRSFVYIGANSSFLYIGEKEGAIQHLLLESEKEYDLLHRKVFNMRDELAGIPHKKENMTDVLKRAERKQKRILNRECVTKRDVMQQKLDLSALDSKIQICRRQIRDINKYRQDLREKIEVINKRIETYIPFPDRRVVDVYDRQWIEPFGKVIIFDGMEIGKFWTLKEFIERSELAPDDEEV